MEIDYIEKRMRSCCKNFFDVNGLQGDLDIPMQFCPYCGYKLNDEEFATYQVKLEEKYRNRLRNKIWFIVGIPYIILIVLKNYFINKFIIGYCDTSFIGTWESEFSLWKHCCNLD